MNALYEIGKDFASMAAHLQALDSRVSALERGPQGSAQTDDPLTPRFVPLSPVTAKSAPVPKGQRDIAVQNVGTFLWKATDVDHCRRVPTPDNAADFVHFGFMLDGLSADDYPAIADTIWPVVSGLYQNDTSASPLYYYRPTGYRGKVCVLGTYNHSASLWTWIAVEFWHFMDNPNSCFSRTYDLNGNVLQSKWGWDPDIIFSLGGYQCNMHFADCDTDYGVGFVFQSLTKQ